MKTTIQVLLIIAAVMSYNTAHADAGIEIDEMKAEVNVKGAVT